MGIVDEYQDCGASQHSLVAAVSEVLPVAVFGDPLQSIFDFGGNEPVDWTDITARGRASHCAQCRGAGTATTRILASG